MNQMRCSLILSAFVLSIWSMPEVLAAGSLDRQHLAFTRELQKYVQHGLVHYRRWQNHSGNLDKYIQSLAKISPEKFAQLDVDDKTALWLNAYNAFTIKVVLDHYPIVGPNKYYPANSLRQIPDVWEASEFIVAGKKYTLEQLEHDSLRQIHDPRTHFSVVCAAKGCTPLSRKAFTGAQIGDEMSRCAKAFLANKRNFEVDSADKSVKVSQVFKWFPLDFSKAAGLAKKFPPPTDDEIVLSYLMKISSSIGEASNVVSIPPDFSSYRVIYRPFDWSLNDADEKPDVTKANSPQVHVPSSH